MAQNSKIEWCDHTLNLWEGCTAVSPACDNCHKYQREAAAFFAEHGRRQRVFVNSLSDFFDNKAPHEWRDDFYQDVKACPDLDFLLLTKRPQNIKKMLPEDWGSGYSNVWMGTTTENQEEADRRIPHLLNTPAAVRFVSAEPLLGPLDLTDVGSPWVDKVDALSGWWEDDNDATGSSTSIGRGRSIDWVIVGGESGPNARPMHPNWARSLRDQCADAGVPFHFKQWGEFFPLDQWEHIPEWTPPDPNGEFFRCGKSRAGRTLDGVEHNGMPEVK